MGRNRIVLVGAAVIVVSIVLLAVLVVFVTGYLQKYLEINYNVDPLLTRAPDDFVELFGYVEG